MNIRWIKTQRDSRALFINDYKFRISRISAYKIYWRCNTNNCTVTAITEDEVLIRTNDHVHEHESDFREIILIRLKEICDALVQNKPFTSAFKIYQKGRLALITEFNWAENIFNYIPIFENIKDSIYRTRNEIVPMINGLFFTISEDFIYTLNNKNFFAFDETIGENRILCFMEVNFVKEILNNEVLRLNMDGTFFSAPRHFSQLYVIHAFKGHKCFPLIYCFLSAKTESLYVIMLLKIKEFLINNGIIYQPVQFLVDFEEAMFNAIYTVHPGVLIRGCYFHFAKVIYRKIQTLGLSNLYRNSSEFKFWIGMVSVLPLVPLNFLSEACLLCNALMPRNNDLVIQLQNYFINTWFSDNSLFTYRIWSHADNFGPRTNNNVEGFHSKLNRMLKIAHPSFYKVLNYIKKVQLENEIDLKIFVSSGAQRNKITRYEKSHQKIIDLRAKFISGRLSLYEFMEKCIGAIKIYE